MRYARFRLPATSPRLITAQLSPKAPSRAMSPARTANGGERPFSPRSAAVSQQPSRVTQKTSRTLYPPLPESTMGMDPSRTPTQRAMSPPARSHAKTPSIAPSDSASHAPKARTRSQKEPSHKPSRSVRSTSELEGGQDIPQPARSTASKISRAESSRREGMWCRSFFNEHISLEFEQRALKL